jgi:alkylresorcinol/alkylpyrone synthase
MIIQSVGRALPRHYYDQATLSAYLQRLWQDRPNVAARARALHESVRVRGRHLALPLETYAQLTTFGKSNDAWIEAAVELGERAMRDALARAGLSPRDVDAIFFSTVTGVASPSIDARLMNRIDLRPDVKRVPMFGLGCVAGAAAVSRAADYVRAYTDQVAVVLTVELCSLTLQRDDVSAANLISTGLFGDGACAAVIAGAARGEARGPRVLATRSVFYPDTEDAMGWQISERGFAIVLSPAVPAIARERLGGDVDVFLRHHGLTRRAVTRWVCHPGGPKVLEALQDALELTADDLGSSWHHLAAHGNLSSASVLMVLADHLDAPPAPGSHGLMLAMGPAFCSELLLLRW